MSIFTPDYSSKFGELKVPHTEELNKIKDYDLLSPCEFYGVLNKECRTYANEATQLWTTGERAKCDHWKAAYEDCQKWETSKDRDALERVLNLERFLFKTRQIDIVLNTVWKSRDKNGLEPPHFNAPLPPSLQHPDDGNQSITNTDVGQYANSTNIGENAAKKDDKKSIENCSIM